MHVRLAQLSDIEGVFALLKRYHVASIQDEDKADGFVTTNMTPKQMEALITTEKGITVAEENGGIRAFAMAASWEFWSVWPLFAYMIERLPEHVFDGTALSVTNSYQYGPICVDKSCRGKGVFEQVFHASLESMRDRFPFMVTFINQINPRSYAAHTNKAAMTTIGTFQFNQNDYYMLACRTGERH